MHPARALRDPGVRRRGGEGRGLPRARHEARPPGRDQGPAVASLEQPGGPAAIRPRGEDDLLPFAPPHLRAPRRRPPGRGQLPRHGIPGRGDSHRPALPRSSSGRTGAAIRNRDRGRSRQGAPAGHRPSGPEARQHHADEVRRQARRFWACQPGSWAAARRGRKRARSRSSRTGPSCCVSRDDRPDCLPVPDCRETSERLPVSRTEPLRIPKEAFAVELALAGFVPRRVEIFVAEQRPDEFRRELVLDLLEHVQAFLPARDAATGEWEIINKDALLWIGVPLAPFGSRAGAGEDELFEFRRSVRVDVIGAEPLAGELLYSAPEQSTRLVDYLNEPGRFLRLWEKETLYLINRAFVLRVVEIAGSP